MPEDYKDKYRHLLGEFDQLQQHSRDTVNQLYTQTTAILANFRDTPKRTGRRYPPVVGAFGRRSVAGLKAGL